MPKKPIIIISVLCVIALALGYWSGQGKRRVASSGDVKSSERKEPEFLRDGLVAYYPFNGNAKDESGNGNDGTLINGGGFAVDRFSSDERAFSMNGNQVSIRFDGLEEYVPTKSQGIGVSFWATRNTHATVLSQYHGTHGTAANNTFFVNLETRTKANGYIWNISGNGEGVFRGTPKNYSDDLWQHWYVQIFPGKDGVGVYVNGELEGWGAFDFNPSKPNIPMYIGHLNNEPAINAEGSIDDLRIYNRALSAEEVKALYEFEKVGVKTIEESGNFKIIKGAFNWDEAKNDAFIRGGRLAVLDTAEALAEAIPVINNFPGSLWIGLSDEDQDGMWQWVDGKPLTFANWAPGQPDNSTGTEKYVHIYWSAGDSLRRWNDSMINDSNAGRGTGNINNNKGYLLELNTIN